MHAISQNDTALWQQVRQDDHAAYEVLYRRYVEIIFAGVFKHITSRADAEDITQDVFLTVWEQRQSIDLKYKFFSYLYSVARYKTYKYIKDKKLTARYETLWEQQQIPGSEEAMLEPDAFRLKDIQEAEYKIDREISGLPPQMKKVYHLKVEKGLTVTQIAEQLIVSNHTVKKQLALIKKRLRGAALRLF